MSPVMLGTAAWAKYTENFIGTFGDKAGDRGESDAIALSTRLSKWDKDLRWRFSKADAQYLRSQANACRYYSVEGVSKARWNAKTTLGEVYVPLELSGRFHQASFVEGFGKAADEVDEEKEPPYIWDLLRQIESNPSYRQIAIIARGGFGKTTLLRHITYRYSYEPRRVCKEKNVPKLLPILLYLRECRGLISQPDAPDLPTLIVKHHLPRLSSKLEMLDIDWAQKLLNGGQALVMLDGFDEVAEDQCEAVSAWIDRAVRDYGQTATFILTTRPAGYERYSGEQPFTAVAVKEFNAKQRNKFLHQWYRCQVKNDRLENDTEGVAEEASREANDLIEQINSREALTKMADNPLLLCMMATYHRINPSRNLPIARPRLYHNFCQMLLEDRPVSKRIQMALPVDESKAVLQGVALEMVQKDCTALSLEEMHALVEKNLRRCVELATESVVTSTNFVQQIEDVSELFVRKQASDEYEFAHRSFQEYLAAVEVKRQQDEGLLLSLKAEWRDTAVLYAAQTNPTQLIEQLCEKGDRRSLDLAYDCWLENALLASPRLVSEETFSALQELCYQQLEKYMIEGNWRAADLYNYRVMIQARHKRYGDYFTGQELITFPCADLLRLDRLWVQHSGGKFGFSVQKDIYVQCGGKLDGKYYEKPWAHFFRAVGWCKEGSAKYDSIITIAEKKTYRSYDELIFSKEKSVKGHLPVWNLLWEGLWSLFSHPDL
ncbi:MAG: GUN4 domain-containing protein [Cyanobacteria bacterium J06560_6]